MTSEESKVPLNSIENLDTVVKELAESDMTKVVLEELKNLTLRYVRRMRLIPYPDFDYNSYPFMSKIIVEELFAYAQEHPKEKIRMFIGDINSEFYGQDWLLDRASELAKKGINFNIILAKPPVSESRVKWQRLITRFPEQVTVRMKPSYNDKLCHLILVGDAYRIEAPHEDYEGKVTDLEPLRPARFAFHDRAYAQNEVLKHWETEVDIDDVEDLHIA